MANDDPDGAVGTITTVWIVVIVVLVALSLVGFIIAIWAWRRHVRRRRKRMEAFYATPIQQPPPETPQYPNYNYSNVNSSYNIQPQPTPPPPAQLDAGEHAGINYNTQTRSELYG